MPEEEIVEDLLLDTSQAKLLAEKFRATDTKAAKPDPCKSIPCSLLSAKHIKQYVEKTGLVSPFYSGPRLKKAAYEGRMGDAAYHFKNGADPERVLTAECKYLDVPANSIVYVETDLEFRLPEFIALRFNLQSRHVHRGLLLGTGPLVDPGFWGKLCIPLHNLTDEDYRIPRDEGLIWLEFTKTTLDSCEDDTGHPPLKGEEFWDIMKFLKKASLQLDTDIGPIPLRSSLPGMFGGATEKAEAAANDAEHAKKDASTARAAAERARNIGTLTAIATLVGTVIALTALWITFWAETKDFAQEVSPITASVADLQNLQGAHELELNRLRAEYEQEIQRFSTTLTNLQSEIAMLSQQLREIEEALSVNFRSPVPQ